MRCIEGYANQHTRMNAYHQLAGVLVSLSRYHRCVLCGYPKSKSNGNVVSALTGGHRRPSNSQSPVVCSCLRYCTRPTVFDYTSYTYKLYSLYTMSQFNSASPPDNYSRQQERCDMVRGLEAAKRTKNHTPSRNTTGRIRPTD